MKKTPRQGHLKELLYIMKCLKNSCENARKANEKKIGTEKTMTIEQKTMMSL